MAFNGSGVFNRVRNWAQDKINALNPTAARFDEHDDDVASGISNCITKDGQTTITQNIPFNSKKITGLGDATAATDALNRQTGDGRYTQAAGNNVLTGTLTLSNAAPGFRLNETDAAANNRNWFLDANGEQIRWYLEDDIFVPATPFLNIQRTGNQCDSVNWSMTAFTVNGVNVNDAAILSTGTLGDARHSANVGMVNATRTVSALWTFSTRPKKAGGFLSHADANNQDGNIIITNVVPTDTSSMFTGDIKLVY